MSSCWIVTFRVNYSPGIWTPARLWGGRHRENHRRGFKLKICGKHVSPCSSLCFEVWIKVKFLILCIFSCRLSMPFLDLWASLCVFNKLFFQRRILLFLCSASLLCAPSSPSFGLTFYIYIYIKSCNLTFLGMIIIRFIYI
jgi:hypothetical protein